MLDPTKSVEKMAVQVAKSLDEDWEGMSEERKAKFRIVAFFIYEEILTTYHVAIQDSILELNDLQTAHSTPKRWLPGIKEAANALSVTLEFEKQRTEIGASVPESLLMSFTNEDPYADFVAGDQAPVMFIGELCGNEHEDGWTCTREVHDPTWLHWDADKEYFPPASGEILATWYGSEDELTSIHPALVDSE